MTREAAHLADLSARPQSSDPRLPDSGSGKAIGSATECLSCTATLAAIRAFVEEMRSLSFAWISAGTGYENDPAGRVVLRHGKVLRDRLAAILPDPSAPLARVTALEAEIAELKGNHETRRIAAYRQARIFEPSMDGYYGALAVYEAGFGAEPPQAAEAAEARADAAEQHLSALRNPADIIAASFIVGWWPGLEDGISWGSEGSAPEYEAAKRVYAIVNGPKV